MAQRSEWPTLGTVTIKFSVSPIGGQPRLGWEFSSDPQLDARHAITLLRDVVDELEIDLPDDEE
jgi:hypothetical protein